MIYSRLLKEVQLEGPNPWYNWVVPAKVGAHKSFLFTEGSLVDV